MFSLLDVIFSVMRVVIDPSVVVAAVINPGGVASALLQMVLADSPLEVCHSLPLLSEYHDVLGRPKLLRKAALQPEEIHTLLQALESVATKVDILLPVRPSAADPDDDLVVQLVVNGRAERLVTYNIRDFEQAARAWGFSVCTPGALLHEIRER